MQLRLKIPRYKVHDEWDLNAIQVNVIFFLFLATYVFLCRWKECAKSETESMALHSQYFLTGSTLCSVQCKASYFSDM